MATVTSDILANATLKRDIGGSSATREFHVKLGPPERALSHPDVPRVGDFHPTEFGIFALSVTATSFTSSPNQTKVVVEYGIPEVGIIGPADDTSPPVLTVATTLQPAEFPIDVDGNIITVTGANEELQGGNVRGLIPHAVLSFQRREQSSPATKAINNVGTINATDQFGDVASKHKWLCTAINGVTSDAGASYLVSYEFQRNPDTWDATVVFVDPSTGLPLVTATLANGGIKDDVQVYVARSWVELNLG